MDTKIKINLALALLLHKTSKDFIFYNVSKDKDAKILDYAFSNDIIRNRKLYTNFKVVSCIKNNINTITI